jgi:hypothetical protein
VELDPDLRNAWAEDRIRGSNELTDPTGPTDAQSQTINAQVAVVLAHGCAFIQTKPFRSRELAAR